MKDTQENELIIQEIKEEGALSTTLIISSPPKNMKEDGVDTDDDDKKEIQKLVTILPKTQHHLHLDGSLSVDFIIQRAKSRDIKLPVENPEENLRDFLMHEKAKQSHDPGEQKDDGKNWPVFDFCNQFLQSKVELFSATYDLCSRMYYTHNVKCLEIRFCPVLHMKEGLSEEQVVDSVVSGFNTAQRHIACNFKKYDNQADNEEVFFDDYFDDITTTTTTDSIRTNIKSGLKGGIIICALRSYDVQHAMNMMNLTLNWLNHGVIGFDIAGDEATYPLSKFSSILEYGNEIGVPMTVHAGEWPGSVRNVKEALKYLPMMKRIGHGIALQDDEELMEYIAEDQKLCIEVCLTANIGWKVKDYDVHPIKKFFKYGIPCSLNCDNLLLSGDLNRQPDPTGEIIHLIKDVGMDYVALREMLLDGIKHSLDDTIDDDWLQCFTKEVDSILFPTDYGYL